MKLYSISFTMDLDDEDHVPALLAIVPEGQDIKAATQEALKTAGLAANTRYAMQGGLLLTDNEEDGSATVWRDKGHGQIIDENFETFMFIVYPKEEEGSS